MAVTQLSDRTGKTKTDLSVQNVSFCHILPHTEATILK